MPKPRGVEEVQAELASELKPATTLITERSRELRHRYFGLLHELNALNDRVTEEGRDFNHTEMRHWNRQWREFEAMRAAIRAEEQHAARQYEADLGRPYRGGPDISALASSADLGATPVPLHGRAVGDVVLSAAERVLDWSRRHQPQRFVDAEFGSELADTGYHGVGRMIHGLVTGHWDGASEPIRSALIENTNTAGGYLTPEPLASMFIDRVRNQMRVVQAGAVTIPLTSDIVNVPRLTGGASVAWKQESNPITPSDMTFDRVTFTPRTLPILVLMSRELFEDVQPEAMAGIEKEISQALALEFDRVALRGSGTAPEPRGILNQSGVASTTLGSPNGATPSWDSMIDGVSVIRNSSIDPNAGIMSPRTLQTLQKLKDSQQRYLATPPPFDQIPLFSSAQIPINLTVGTSSDCSEIYLAAWANLLLGIRTDLRFQIRVLEERYVDNLQVGLLTYLRADVQLAHAEGFNILKGVRP